MAKEIIQHYAAEDLNALIRAKYPGPAWTVLHELRDGTGFNTAGRSADAIAFSTWPSRGLSIVGFENKSYRGDWIKELSQPEKAESIARFCDSWYLVCAENVAKLEEIPAAWGWLVPTAKGLKEMKAPQPTEVKPITRIFLMAIMRQIEKNYVSVKSVDDLVKARVKDEMISENRRGVQIKEDFEKMKAKVEEFKAASGLDILNTWKVPAKELGRAVKAVMDYDDRLSDKIRKAEVQLNSLTETCESMKALKILNIKEEAPEVIDWKRKL